MPVHPHIRGEYYFFLDGRADYFGSSPHTWGILKVLAPAILGYRFIPTYVGNTLAQAEIMGCDTVHPHIRGEYIYRYTLSQYLIGSSPHTWGILAATCSDRQSRRFIPTYVGNTQPQTPSFLPPAVHPHIRGEYMLNPNLVKSFDGSSPHTWGILQYIDYASIKLTTYCVTIFFFFTSFLTLIPN